MCKIVYTARCEITRKLYRLEDTCDCSFCGKRVSLEVIAEKIIELTVCNVCYININKFPESTLYSFSEEEE